MTSQQLSDIKKFKILPELFGVDGRLFEKFSFSFTRNVCSYSSSAFFFSCLGNSHLQQQYEPIAALCTFCC